MLKRWKIAAKRLTGKDARHVRCKGDEFERVRGQNSDLKEDLAGQIGVPAWTRPG